MSNRLTRLPFGPERLYLEIAKTPPSFLPAQVNRTSAELHWMNERIFGRVEPLLANCRTVHLRGHGLLMRHPGLEKIVSTIRSHGASTVLELVKGEVLDEASISRLRDLQPDGLVLELEGSTAKASVDALASLNSWSSKLQIHLETAVTSNTIASLQQVFEAVAEGGFGSILAWISEPDPEEAWGDAWRAAMRTAHEAGIHVELRPLQGRQALPACFFRQLFVTWDGLVMTCTREQHAIGDLKGHDAEAIWNGPFMAELRRRYHDESLHSTCPGCLPGDPLF